MAVETLTFGCRLNAYESEVARAEAEKAGLSSALIVNTCAVTAEAVRQAKQAIRKARREAPERPIIVTGCAAQTTPRDFADMAEVDLVLGRAACVGRRRRLRGLLLEPACRTAQVPASGRDGSARRSHDGILAMPAQRSQGAPSRRHVLYQRECELRVAR